MLEMLCVLTIAALLLIVSIRQYHAKQLNTDQTMVRSDVALLSDALRAYVQKIGCYNADSDHAGYFSGATEPSLQAVASAASVILPERRDPIIRQYEFVVDDVTNASDTGPRVRHRLWVKGVLGDAFQAARDSMAALLGGTVCGSDLCWSVSMLSRDNAAGEARTVHFLRYLSEQDSSVVDKPTSLAACWLRGVSFSELSSVGSAHSQRRQVAHPAIQTHTPSACRRPSVADSNRSPGSAFAGAWDVMIQEAA